MQTLEAYKNNSYLPGSHEVTYHLTGTNLYWNGVDSTRGLLEAFAVLSAGGGWPRDASVGTLLATYSSKTHPEFFI